MDFGVISPTQATFRPSFCPSPKTSIPEDSLYYKLLARPLLHIQTFHLPSGRQIISGVEKVIDGGNATDSVKLCGLSPPRYFWYCVSGTLCDVVQLAFDLSFQLMGIQDPSVNWMLSFFFSIGFRHSSHRYLVFGEYNGTYYESLVRMYISYTFVVLLSTAFNVVMVRTMRLGWMYAWVITLVWTGGVNYFIIKQLWGVGGEFRKGESQEETVVDKITGAVSRALSIYVYFVGWTTGRKMKRENLSATDLAEKGEREEGEEIIEGGGDEENVTTTHRGRIDTGGIPR